MSVKLMIALAVLLFTNQLLGTLSGSWKDGYNKALFVKGLKKIGIIALGYGALGFVSWLAGKYVPSAEYLSGLLIEPISKYFSKICETLRGMLGAEVEG